MIKLYRKTNTSADTIKFYISKSEVKAELDYLITIENAFAVEKNNIIFVLVKVAVG